MPLEYCQNIMLLRNSDWFATRWGLRPGIYWRAPSGTCWLCETNLWPWLPLGWIDKCTLGFPGPTDTDKSPYQKPRLLIYSISTLDGPDAFLNGMIT